MKTLNLLEELHAVLSNKMVGKKVKYMKSFPNSTKEREIFYKNGVTKKMIKEHKSLDVNSDAYKKLTKNIINEREVVKTTFIKQCFTGEIVDVELDSSDSDIYIYLTVERGGESEVISYDISTIFYEIEDGVYSNIKNI